jgi:hypothetical protein
LEFAFFSGAWLLAYKPVTSGYTAGPSFAPAAFGYKVKSFVELITSADPNTSASFTNPIKQSVFT